MSISGVGLKFYQNDVAVATAKSTKSVNSTEKAINAGEKNEGAYRRVATAGWERTTDCNLAIGYKDGYLYDLDTSYGYGPGQTAWQDRVRSWYEGVQEEYSRKREEELRREENAADKFEMAVKETEDYMRETFGEGSVSGSQGAEVQLISPNLSELQKLLNRLQREGMIVPLTKKILRLPGRVATQGGFDMRA